MRTSRIAKRTLRVTLPDGFVSERVTTRKYQYAVVVRQADEWKDVRWCFTHGSAERASAILEKRFDELKILPVVDFSSAMDSGEVAGDA